MSLLRGAPRALTAAVLATCVLVPLFSTAAIAQEDDADLNGYSTRAEPLTNGDWVDPAITFDLESDALVPAPEFDVSTLHDSTVFAAGIDQLPVENENLQPLIDRHVRVLQVIDTLDRELESTALSISIRRPRVGRLNAAIAHEHQEEARLATEIDILNAAIAEFAVRAFISEDEIDTALTVPDSGLSETRVVTDEIRGDQIMQIADRRAELASRQARRAELEEDLRVVRSELRTLRRERALRLDHQRDATELLTHTAATYQVALHERLPEFVDGTDIPLVALNAYVIAERIVAEQDPTCGVEWWMLAGIGKIESIHGHFGNSTLDINGNTTDPISGPALDGRILEGAEFLVEGVELPEATDKTEAIELAANADESDASTGSLSAPAPVIKRLALIKDTDDGRLDNDTTYDRAVGPMQFIPQTWRQYEQDANADDKTDPQNIYDATLASAKYLCAAASTVTTSEGQQRAYFAYNHDTEYSESVAAAADRYRKKISIPDEEYGSSLFLGLADPALQTAAGKAAEDIKTFDDHSLLDW